MSTPKKQKNEQVEQNEEKKPKTRKAPKPIVKTAMAGDMDQSAAPPDILIEN